MKGAQGFNEDRLKEIIREACMALAGYRCPSLTKDQQERELARCWELLAGVVYAGAEDESR